ncbi:MAG: wax ester/triacylglycerol synthase family O-acyltransferase [Thermoanaerobaculia bacterium]
MSSAARRRRGRWRGCWRCRPIRRRRSRGALGRSKRVAWTEQVPLDDVKAVGKAHGGTVNDVLNAAMVGGLRRYLARDGRPDESLAVRGRRCR